MTGVERGGGAPMGPPWPVEVLADLHAGALDDAVAAELWPRVRNDPSSRAVLAALDATRADLGGLAALPPPRMPANLAARLDNALAQEARTRPAPYRSAPQQPGPRQFGAP